jgi:hypothetical protein
VLIFEVFSFAQFPFDAILEDVKFVRYLTDSTAKPLHLELGFTVWGVQNPPAHMQQLMEECVRRDPKQRPVFQAIADRTSRYGATAAVKGGGGVVGVEGGGGGARGGEAVNAGGYLTIGGVEGEVAESGL